MGTEAFLKIQEAAGCPSCCLNNLEKEAKPRGRAEKKNRLAIAQPPRIS